ncbi:GNAT family N-acetyltransferase [Enterococcus alishanensis]
MMEIIFGNQKAVQAASFYLRYQVFVLEQKIPAALEFDGLDTSDRKYLVFFDHELPVATARFQTKTSKILQPDRLCVAKKYRLRGLGQQLLTCLETEGKKNNLISSELSAEMTAIDFYQKQGYQVISEPYKEDGILCVTMKKEL